MSALMNFLQLGRLVQRRLRVSHPVAHRQAISANAVEAHQID